MGSRLKAGILSMYRVLSNLDDMCSSERAHHYITLPRYLLFNNKNCGVVYLWPDGRSLGLRDLVCNVAMLSL